MSEGSERARERGGLAVELAEQPAPHRTRSGAVGDRRSHLPDRRPVSLRRGAAVGFVVAVTLATAGPRSDHAQAATARRATNGRVVMVPASIDATGRDDVSAAMSRFFASVPDNTTVRLRSGARYRMEQPLVLADRYGLTVDGNGATTFATTPGTRKRSHWVIRRGSNVRITRLIVQGANPQAGVTRPAYQVDKEAQQGFQLDGARNVELDDVAVYDVYGDFVYMGRDEAGTWTSNVWIHDSEFVRNGRMGISVTSGRNVVVERNYISDTRQATVDLEPNSQAGGADNIFILNNRIGPGRLLFLAAHGRGPVNNVVVAGNVLDRPLTTDVLPPEGDRRQGFYFVSNTSRTPHPRSPMVLNRIDGVLVRDNRQVVTRDKVAVIARGVCGIAVVGNEFGTGVRPLALDAPACGVAPQAIPAAPMVSGRGNREAAPARSTTSAPTTAEPPDTVPQASPSDSSAAGEPLDPVWIIVALSGLTVVILGAVLYRNRRRPTGRHRHDRQSTP